MISVVVSSGNGRIFWMVECLQCSYSDADVDRECLQEIPRAKGLAKFSPAKLGVLWMSGDHLHLAGTF